MILLKKKRYKFSCNYLIIMELAAGVATDLDSCQTMLEL